jgi:DNA-directed RNA polymerase subunit N (RpoN/RPB10)
MEQKSPEERNLPFSSYPKEELRKCIWIGGSGREYGLRFIQKTKSSCCAYCGRPITQDYFSWLTMVIDHAVPVSVCKALGIPMEFCRSLANMVLACAACNGFDNRYKPSSKRQVSTFEEFLKLRDEVFIERKERIQKKHREQEEFFETKIAPVFG